MLRPLLALLVALVALLVALLGLLALLVVLALGPDLHGFRGPHQLVSERKTKVVGAEGCCEPKLEQEPIISAIRS